MIKHSRKIKKLAKGEEVQNLSTKVARPGAWKKMLLPAKTNKNGDPNGHTQIPPSVQEQIISDIANGRTPKDIAEKYKVSIAYAKEIMMRRFGSKEKMKEALSLMCYENAMAFMGFAAQHIEHMTAPQAVLAAKLSIESGVILEKSDKNKAPEEIDFGALQSLSNAVSRVEKVLTGNQVKELPAS